MVSGAHTELDKLIVEDLSEPLMHIIEMRSTMVLRDPMSALPQV